MADVASFAAQMWFLCRSFKMHTSTIDTLAARWRQELFSTHAWQLDGLRTPRAGSLSGVWLKACDDAPDGAYLKPTTYPCTYPAAAREKIAADLAYELNMRA